jgi:hypothetical protein
MIVNDELGRLWNKEVVAYFKALLSHDLPGGTEKIRIAGLQTDILTKNLPDTMYLGCPDDQYILLNSQRAS